MSGLRVLVVDMGAEQVPEVWRVVTVVMMEWQMALDMACW